MKAPCKGVVRVFKKQRFLFLFFVFWNLVEKTKSLVPHPDSFNTTTGSPRLVIPLGWRRSTCLMSHVKGIEERGSSRWGGYKGMPFHWHAPRHHSEWISDNENSSWQEPSKYPVPPLCPRVSQGFCVTLGGPKSMCNEGGGRVGLGNRYQYLLLN